MSFSLEQRRARPLLGTFVEISVCAPNESIPARAFSSGFAAIAQVQSLMNRHDPESEISRLNRIGAQRPLALHPWTLQVLRAALRFASESEGAFDPVQSGEGSWRDVVLGKDARVHFRHPLTLDLGGIAKGFAVDCAVAAMKSAGALRGLVNAGGDLRVFGPAPERVQIRHPLAPGCSGAHLLLRSRALATSANYSSPALRDGRTGAPLPQNISVTVSARDCLTADALTKVALVLGTAAQPLLARHRAEAFLLEENLPPRWLSRSDAS